MINAQKRIAGKESNSIARLHPMNVVNSPVVNVPHNAPIEFMDPIHDNCPLVKGPVFSGEFSDKSIGKEGDIQPSKFPWLMQITQAVEKNAISLISTKISLFSTFFNLLIFKTFTCDYRNILISITPLKFFWVCFFVVFHFFLLFKFCFIFLYLVTLVHLNEIKFQPLSDTVSLDASL